MPIPAFTTTGDLPLGVHQASLQEVIARFGLAPAQRRAVALRLEECTISPEEQEPWLAS
jgi:hypothetical protein